VLSLPVLLKAMLEHKASDMHITSGSAPSYRVHGQILKAKMGLLTPAQTKELCYSVLTDQQKAQFEEKKQIDFSFGIRDLARFRANVYYQRGAVAGAFRHIPFEIPKLGDLGLPAMIDSLMRKPRGLVLVTGSTGSGKTTTLAAMIDALNEMEHLHIVTIEDPIEYIHSHKASIVNQREIGQDTLSFSGALKAALREDPDVVLVGEMRDKETIEVALQLAETGHLVMSTLHTNSAYQSIVRIIQVFSPEQQDQIRLQLSMTLEGILTQALIERADRQGRALVLELMIPNASIRNLIRENKIYQIPSAMLIGQENTGMITFNQSLMELIRKRVILPEDALSYSPDPDDLLKNIIELHRRSAAS
jgi:twitching motility protein PilT